MCLLADVPGKHDSLLPPTQIRLDTGTGRPMVTLQLKLTVQTDNDSFTSLISI